MISADILAAIAATSVATSAATLGCAIALVRRKPSEPSIVSQPAPAPLPAVLAPAHVAQLDRVLELLTAPVSIVGDTVALAPSTRSIMSSSSGVPDSLTTTHHHRTHHHITRLEQNGCETVEYDGHESTVAYRTWRRMESDPDNHPGAWLFLEDGQERASRPSREV